MYAKEPSMPTITLPQGAIHYTDAGRGPAVVLVHGLFVDARLWDAVVPTLARRHRVVVIELPLGAHRTPMAPDADLSPPGLAALLDAAVTDLGLVEVTLVGNDTGGAICQITAARGPAWLSRLVLTNCDAYDNFLPPLFRPLQLLARVPGGIALLAQAVRTRAARGLPVTYGWLSHRRAPEAVEADWVLRVRTDPGVRRDVVRVLRGIHPRHTLAAIAALRTRDLPVLLAWGQDDRFFTPEFARRLQADLRDARLEPIPGSRTFVPLDAPDRLAELIEGFVPAAR
jgi:pimeloyl-ACP methyl ester carboxylesterase